MNRLAGSLIAAITLLAPPGGGLTAQSCPRDTVTHEALLEAMEEARASGTYSLLAATNSVRFEMGVFERLIERALERRPEGGTLFIPYDALWRDFLITARLSPGEESKVSVGRRLAYEYQQDIELTYGSPGAVIKQIRQGPKPILAANVRYQWSDRPDGRHKYSYEDTLSVPHLKVTDHQVLTFRLLVFPGMTVLDDIDGISGRPLTGVLGAMFKVLGEGNAVYARFSLSNDGLQVVRTKAKKLLTKTVTTTVNPDGSVENGLPEGRTDLMALEADLKKPLEFDYYPYYCWSSR